MARRPISPSSSKKFSDLGGAISVIAGKSPHRMTTSQVIFFLEAARAILAGERPTYTSIKDSIGPRVNRSLKTTYRVLLEPSREYPKSLFWLKRTPNPLDKREKIFDLTPEGRAVIEAAMSKGQSK